MSQLKQSFERKLIEEVKQNEFLYNTKNISYRKGEIKRRSWRNIAKKLNTTEEICKKRWKGLRDTYRRAKKLGKNKNIKWAYFENLKFLDDFETTVDETAEYPNEKIFFKNTDSMEYSKEDNKFEFQDEDSLLSIDNVSLPTSYKTLQTTENKNTNTEQEQTTSNEQIKKNFCNLLETTVNKLDKSFHRNSTAQLFESLATTVIEANLPMKIRIDLQAKVLELVYDTINDYISSSSLINEN